MVALGYSSMLHYFALEFGLRPVLVDINQQVTPRTEGLSALPLRWRLLLTLPLINLITGMTVAALTSDGGGGADLGLDVAIAVGVATTIALELTVLLSKSIQRPIADLTEATEAVMAGDFSVSVPVTTGDEIGDLAASFNEMVQGLAEREKIREAFGTYLDREVAEYILSDAFDEEGIELDVSILFTDVKDFTELRGRGRGEGGRGLPEPPVRGGRADHRATRRARGQVRGRRLAGGLRRSGAVPRPRDQGNPRRDGDLPPRERARRGGRAARRRGRQHGPRRRRCRRRRGPAQLQRDRRRGQRRGARGEHDPRARPRRAAGRRDGRGDRRHDRRRIGGRAPAEGCRRPGRAVRAGRASPAPAAAEEAEPMAATAGRLRRGVGRRISRRLRASDPDR